MIMKLYKSWILLKSRFKNGNQKNVRVGYVEFTLIEQVFFKKKISLKYFLKIDLFIEMY